MSKVDQGERRMGPLQGLKIIEMGAIGPVPFAGMLLSDMGAEVIRIDRLTPSGLGMDKETRFDITRRGRRSIAVDLKQESGRALVLQLIEQADGLIEGFRPGVMERLGLGPSECLAQNPRLVFGRMTGFGQTGPLANYAGHDLNYLAMSGALGMIGRKGQPPAVPLNLVADLGGGALYLALGLLAGLLEAKTSGKGQVVDAAMIDGITSMMATYYGFSASNNWVHEPESNFLDGGAPWYNVYETSDEKFITVGAIERKFYHQMLKGMGLNAEDLPPQFDRATWPDTCVKFAEIFKTRTRDEWEQAMDGLDACFAPVLSLEEAIKSQQVTARNTTQTRDGVVQPSPAPRFDRTPAEIQGAPRADGADTDAILQGWGFSDDASAKLRANGVIA
jgi:alpha-methylacyl-CoA racemase